jgi:hypothetical protein
MKRGIALLSLLQLAAPALALEIRVGADAGCNTNSLETALTQARASNGGDVIRVAANQAYANQALYIDTDVELYGGYASCDAPAPTGRTALTGTGTWAALVIYGDSASISVRVEGFDISGGGASGDIGNFGGVNIGGRSFVRLADLRLHDNLGIFGGGLSVEGANAIVTLEHQVEIDRNRANIGGGVAVSAGTLRVRPQAVTIRNNTGNDGGGLFIGSAGLVSVGDDPEDTRFPVDGFAIHGNSANQDGGGVYLDGAGSKLLAESIVVRDNSAARDGGGIFAANGAYAQFTRWNFTPGRRCGSGSDCLRLSGNSAQNGGALQLASGATASINQAIVRDNHAIHGTVLNMRGNSSQLRMTGSVVARNACDTPDCAPFWINGGGRVRFSFTTFAGNSSTITAQSLVYAFGPIGSQGGMEFYHSLLSGTPRLAAVGNTAYTMGGDCVLKDSGSVESGYTRSDVAPVSFVDPAGNDYRLRAGNAAIDYCTAGNPAPEDPDIDGVTRGLESPGNANEFGSFDLGAYEFERIFGASQESPR